MNCPAKFIVQRNKRYSMCPEQGVKQFFVHRTMDQVILTWVKYAAKSLADFS